MPWLSVEIVVYCQVEVTAISRSVVRRSPTECGVFECDNGNSTMRRSTRGCRAMEKNYRSKPINFCRELFAVYCGGLTKYRNTARGRVKKFSAVKQVAYIHAVYTLP